MISFSTDNITINESDKLFWLHLNRTGSLDYSFNISAEIVTKNFNNKSFALPGKFIFLSRTSQVTELAVVLDDIMYNGKRTARYCLVSPQQEREQETRFIHQCINIVVYDEDDCK